jgi:hypothetical protein
VQRPVAQLETAPPYTFMSARPFAMISTGAVATWISRCTSGKYRTGHLPPPRAHVNGKPSKFQPPNACATSPPRTLLFVISPETPTFHSRTQAKVLIEGKTMMATLVEECCIPCRGGVPPLTAEEAESFRTQAPDWTLLNDAHRIERTFRFGVSGRRSPLSERSATSPRSKAITPTSASVGATRPSRCARRRSRDCRRTTSSWRPR